MILLSSYFKGLTWPGAPREAWASLLEVSVGGANPKWKHYRSLSSREAREFANGSVCLECDSQCERMDGNALTCLGQVRTSLHISHLEKHHLVQGSWISWCLAADVRGFKCLQMSEGLNVCRSGSPNVFKLVGPPCHRGQFLVVELSQDDLWAHTNLSDQVRRRVLADPNFSHMIIMEVAEL